MKYLPLTPLFSGLISASDAFTSQMMNVLATFVSYALKDNTEPVLISDFKIKDESKDEGEADLFIKFYCSVFTPNGNVDF